MNPIPLVELELSLPVPVTGWGIELDRLGVAIVLDDIGRPSISRAAARELIAEHREQQEAAARKREEIERQAVERDRQFRARLHPGIPADAVPIGLTAAGLMMASDPMGEGSRRESVLEHALSRRGDADALARGDGAIIYHPIQEES